VTENKKKIKKTAVSGQRIPRLKFQNSQFVWDVFDAYVVMDISLGLYLEKKRKTTFVLPFCSRNVFYTCVNPT